MSYDTLTTLHSLSAYIWLGSLFGTLVFTTLVSRRTPAGLITGATAIVRFSTRVGLPAAVVLLLSGIWMIGTGNAPAGGLWLTLGFVAWLVAAVVGSAVMHPAARKMRAASNADEAIAFARRIALVGGAEIVLIVIGIWLMGAQPGS